MERVLLARTVLGSAGARLENAQVGLFPVPGFGMAVAAGATDILADLLNTGTEEGSFRLALLKGDDLVTATGLVVLPPGQRTTLDMKVDLGADTGLYTLQAQRSVNEVWDSLGGIDVTIVAVPAPLAVLGLGAIFVGGAHLVQDAARR